jgi:hypothetical protein
LKTPPDPLLIIGAEGIVSNAQACSGYKYASMHSVKPNRLSQGSVGELMVVAIMIFAQFPG